MAANSSSEILIDIFPLARVYKDGRVERIGDGEEFLPPSIDTETGVESKDIKISSDLNVSARIYLPENARSGHKIPLLIYFHGGGFVIETAFSPTYHNHMNSLAAEANVVIVSVDYRRAPENPLPAAYEDSWLAIKWVAAAASSSNGESSDSWLKDYADFNKVYFGGDSAGGNLAHHMALKVDIENLEGLNLVGMFLNCPFFWGKEPIGIETSKPKGMNLIDTLWHFVHPNTKGLDDPLLNPFMDPNLSLFKRKKILVFVAENDVLRDRGWHYKEELMKTNWDGEINIVEFKEEDHVFNLNFPNSQNSKSMLKMLASFLNEV